VQSLTNSSEDRWDDFLYSIGQTEKAALDVFVVVFQKFV
jgi:hypothetical protein